MYYLDKIHHNGDSSIVRRTTSFRYPLSRNREGRYKIQSGEKIHVCLNSDFFIEEADAWRQEAWEIMRERSDVIFTLLTKRPERVKDYLPKDWTDGWENIVFHITCENQKRAEERVPILLELPFKHKGIMCAPLLGEIDLEPYLISGQIEQVIAGGENYDGSRPCDFNWVRKLRSDCEKQNVTFVFIETGTRFIKDGKEYHIPSKLVQAEMAFKSGMSYQGKAISYRYLDRMGLEIPEDELYVPHYRERCSRCSNRAVCNGCTDFGRCKT